MDRYLNATNDIAAAALKRARLAALDADAVRREANALKRQYSRECRSSDTSRRHEQIACAAGGSLSLGSELGTRFPTGQTGQLQWPDRG
jgi:hypothetical protein